MIIDNIKNIGLYTQIPEHVVQYIKNLSVDVDLGKYYISDSDYVNVETYETKNHENCLFEAHKDYADIQILLTGKEQLDYVDSKDLNIKVPYNPDKDIMFYENNIKESCSVYLDGTNFVYIAPTEAHRPQMNIDNISVPVKKVVVKIKM